jgi:hypothetical protein
VLGEVFVHQSSAPLCELAELVAFFGGEPHTPLDPARHATLGRLGCLS